MITREAIYKWAVDAGGDATENLRNLLCLVRSQFWIDLGPKDLRDYVRDLLNNGIKGAKHMDDNEMIDELVVISTRFDDEPDCRIDSIDRLVEFSGLNQSQVKGE